MDDLEETIEEEVKFIMAQHDDFAPPGKAANDVVGGNSDIEQVITFFDESPSPSHRKIAEELRQVFEKMLQTKLLKI